MTRTSKIACALALIVSACGNPTEDRQGPELMLLISSDTLRADRLGAYGSDRGLTPNLDGLASEGTVFECAYAPASFTVPSVSTILSGRYPTQNAIISNEHALPLGVTTIAQELRASGFATGAVVSNWVLRRQTGLDRGFDEYDDRMQDREKVRSAPERLAPDTTRDALACLDRLRGAGDRMFLWVHYQDPHGPYTPPAQLFERSLREERGRPGADRKLAFGKDHRGLGAIPTYQRMGDYRRVGRYLAAYHAEIRYMDLELGRLLDGVRERGLYDDAWIVFVADHGEGLGEDDYWFAHGEYLSDALVRVPLMIRRPGADPARRTDVVSLADLMPTLLSTAGSEVPPGLPGRDLFATGAREHSSQVLLATLKGATVARFGLVHGGHKYIATYDAKGAVSREELYRLNGEGADLASTSPDDLVAFRAELARTMERFQPGQAGVQQELNDEARRALEALGYGGGSDD